MGEISYSKEELNQMKWQLYDQLPYVKRQVAQLYQELMENGEPWAENIWSRVVNFAEMIQGGMLLFDISQQIKEKGDWVQNRAEGRTGEREQLLADMYEVLDEMERYMGVRAKHCNVCDRDVFFRPISAAYRAMRRQHGFPYWNAEFQLENRDNYECPLCGACARDRLIIAFLEELQAENGEKLRMLQIAPSQTVERYALGRPDIWYETMDMAMLNINSQADLRQMDMVEDETYDIIICSHVLEHIENDISAMGELYRILKPDGVCLVLVPLIIGLAETDEQWGRGEEENWRRFGQGDHSRLYGRMDLIRRLQSAGFYVNELGKEWFGEELYEKSGFDDSDVLYVATRQLRLTEELGRDMEKELAELQKENRLLHQALNDINNRLVELDKATGTNTTILFHTLDNIGWEINDPRFQKRLWYPKIMSIDETMDAIVNGKKSIARFGDGEFGIMCGVQRWRFQKKDETLARRLREVLQSEQENIMIGLADFYGEFEHWTNRAANGVRLYLTPEVRKQHYALLNRDKVYANARISRSESLEMVKRQKRIWDGRDCVFIEGFQTRMGVGNDLFDNVGSIVRILCPAENAFDRYGEIYREALKQPKDRLMLIALGPTAGVLVYDLAMQGYQAIDIGHADLSYEWLLSGNHGKVPGKYSNEVPGGYIVEAIHDAAYESQVIADFR